MKQFLALALVGLCFLGCEPEGAENSSSRQTETTPVESETSKQDETEQEADKQEADVLRNYLVRNLNNSQIDTVNALVQTSLSDVVTQNVQLVLLLENNRILNNLVGVIDETDSLRIMRLTAERHGFKLVKIK